MLHRVLLAASASAYALALVLLALTPARRGLYELRAFRRVLCLGVFVHLGFSLSLMWWLGRPPFFSRAELISWFGLGCAGLSLIGLRWLYSRFVVIWGVGCGLAITLWLAVSYSPQTIHDLAPLHRFTVWWYGFATPLGFGAGFLAFAAQMRAALSRLRAGRPERLHAKSVDEESMTLLSTAMVRLGYPLIVSGVLAFALGSLETVGRGWYWQRSVAAQLFTLVVYTLYLHLAASETSVKPKPFLAQTVGFCGLLASVLSFGLPESLIGALGLGLFL